LVLDLSERGLADHPAVDERLSEMRFLNGAPERAVNLLVAGNRSSVCMPRQRIRGSNGPAKPIAPVPGRLDVKNVVIQPLAPADEVAGHEARAADSRLEEIAEIPQERAPSGAGRVIAQ
jgi:hypothetical protein